jgi:chemotaxis protein methyltransferase CheR
MAAALNKALLGEVSGLIAEHMGLSFPEERWPDLARGLKTAGQELGFEDPDVCLRWLRTKQLTPRQIETLARHLTIGETYFFRDPASFEALEQEILPPLVAQRARAGRTLRLWSAGCCSGEEAYSLAITCARALPELSTWDVSILATDINSKFLAKAEAGVYSPWSFRGAPDWLRDRFFSPAQDKKLAIDPTVKRLVYFNSLNLAEDTYPSLHNHTNSMDVILCRNVLMYFTADHQRRVVAALHRCLVDGGYLLVNPAEASSWLFPMFSMETIGEVVVFRKTTRPTRAPPLSLPEPMWLALPSLPVAAALPVPSTTPISASLGTDALLLAQSRANQGRLEEALALCQKAIEAERTNPAAHFLYATICQELGRPEEAIAALHKVLYLDQDFVLAHHALGGLYERLGKQKESKRHLAVAFTLLSARSRDELVPESGGMTCGRLLESVRALEGG